MLATVGKCGMLSFAAHNVRVKGVLMRQTLGSFVGHG